MLRASLEIKAWCKEHSKYRLPSRWHLSKTRLSLKRGKFVHYVGKGWHVSVILGFLRDFMENLNVDSDLKMLVWSGDELMSFLHAERQNRGLLLTEAGIHQVTVLGDFHLKMLLVASQKHTGFPTYRLFNVRPKFHGMSHILDFASTGRNPVTQSCWMEEDWVRKVANLAKRTHARKTKLSTLQRYSAGVAIWYALALYFAVLDTLHIGRIKILLGTEAGAHVWRFLCQKIDDLQCFAMCCPSFYYAYACQAEMVMGRP